MKKSEQPIGFIGQGWIGKNYANDFEARGFATVRYALEEPYIANKDKIKDCRITLIAVPTPTTPKGFDSRIVEEALGLIGKGNIAVIKSTILPGTTARFQKDYPDIIVLYAPEFLSEATAAHDAAHPFSNIIGLSEDDEKHQKAAQEVLAVLPEAPFTEVCSSTEAEIVKYTHNMSGYVQIVLFNMLYDLAQQRGADWQNIQKALEADPYIPNRYARPVHKSGRGAGGGCFIKDFAALRELYQKALPEDTAAINALRALECKNIDLLVKSGKDPELLRGVYGEHPEKECAPLEIAEDSKK
jgi:nucleotide sugar dehydrogenase